MILSQTIRRHSLSVLSVALATTSFTGIALASHSWGGYHWARTNNPFTVDVGNNVTNAWTPYLSTTATDWSVSTVLDAKVVTGKSKGNCQPTLGRVEVCNAKYGNNGWLGIASVWANGTHITQGTVKMNDTYFATAKYNTSAWKNLVMCQEVGHTFGLDHQDENFSNSNLGTCMDYTNDPTTNQHPNAHDYEELGIIYGHLDSTTTLIASKSQGAANQTNEDTTDPSKWGKVLKKDSHGRPSLHERDLGKGQKIFTFVLWADETN